MQLAGDEEAIERGVELLQEVVNACEQARTNARDGRLPVSLGQSLLRKCDQAEKEFRNAKYGPGISRAQTYGAEIKEWMLRSR